MMKILSCSRAKLADILFSTPSTEAAVTAAAQDNPSESRTLDLEGGRTTNVPSAGV